VVVCSLTGHLRGRSSAAGTNTEDRYYEVGCVLKDCRAKRSAFPVMLFLLCMMAAGCGSGGSNSAGSAASSAGASPTNASSGPISPSSAPSTPVVGVLAASPASLNFGSVVVGGASAQTVQVTNTGGTALTISSASTSGPGFSVSGINLPVALNSGQSIKFNVNFVPSNGGTATGSVSLANNGAAPLQVLLSGTGVAPTPHSVLLSWSPSTSATGYNIYRSLQTGGPYVKNGYAAGTSYTDLSVNSGQTYFYVLTAVNAQNLESGYSTEVRAAIPIP
jgi:hypothetical protein